MPYVSEFAWKNKFNKPYRAPIWRNTYLPFTLAVFSPQCLLVEWKRCLILNAYFQLQSQKERNYKKKWLKKCSTLERKIRTEISFNLQTYTGSSYVRFTKRHSCVLELNISDFTGITYIPEILSFGIGSVLGLARSFILLEEWRLCLRQTWKCAWLLKNYHESKSPWKLLLMKIMFVMMFYPTT